MSIVVCKQWIIPGILPNLFLILLLCIFTPLTTQAGTYCADSVANASECAGYALIMADHLQSRQIRQRDDLREANSLLCGDNPSEMCMLGMSAIKISGLYYVNHKMPNRNIKLWGHPARLSFNIIFDAFQGYAVYNNYGLGLKVRW